MQTQPTDLLGRFRHIDIVTSDLTRWEDAGRRLETVAPQLLAEVLAIGLEPRGKRGTLCVVGRGGAVEDRGRCIGRGTRAALRLVLQLFGCGQEEVNVAMGKIIQLDGARLAFLDGGLQSPPRPPLFPTNHSRLEATDARLPRRPRPHPPD